MGAWKSGGKPVDVSGRIRALLMGRHYSKRDSGLAMGSVDNVEIVRSPTGERRSKKLTRLLVAAEFQRLQRGV